MRRDVPHIEKREEGKRRERGGEKESRKRKSFRLEGSPSVKQKKGSARHRETVEKQRAAAEEDRICIIREERDAKRGA